MRFIVNIPVFWVNYRASSWNFFLFGKKIFQNNLSQGEVFSYSAAQYFYMDHRAPVGERRFMRLSKNTYKYSICLLYARDNKEGAGGKVVKHWITSFFSKLYKNSIFFVPWPTTLPISLHFPLFCFLSTHIFQECQSQHLQGCVQGGNNILLSKWSSYIIQVYKQAPSYGKKWCPFYSRLLHTPFHFTCHGHSKLYTYRIHIIFFSSEEKKRASNFSCIVG